MRASMCAWKKVLFGFCWRTKLNSINRVIISRVWGELINYMKFFILNNQGKGWKKEKTEIKCKLISRVYIFNCFWSNFCQIVSQLFVCVQRAERKHIGEYEAKFHQMIFNCSGLWRKRETKNRT
jgi:hypothetical protein